MLHIKDQHRSIFKWAILVIVLFSLILFGIFLFTKKLTSDADQQIAVDDLPPLFDGLSSRDASSDETDSSDEAPEETSSENNEQDPATKVDQKSASSLTKTNPNQPNSSSTSPLPASTEPAPIKVTGITLNKSALTLVRNNSTTLTATVSPSNASNPTVSWSSSNTNVATVTNSGRIAALHKGTTLITAKTQDGDYTASATLTVINPELVITPWIYQSTIIANGTSSQGVATGINVSGGSDDYLAKIEVYRNNTLIRTGYNRVDVAGSGTYYAKWTVNDAEEGTRTGTTGTVVVP